MISARILERRKDYAEIENYEKAIADNTQILECHHRLEIMPFSEKPMFVSRCKEIEVCESVKNKGCRGCNVWNYLYDIKTLHKWCKEHNKDFMQYTMEMHRCLRCQCEDWTYTKEKKQ